jgi:hypothetical protein
VSFIVGIDLGTTHCAVAYVEKSTLVAPLGKSEKTSRAVTIIPKIHTFDIPQLVRPGVVESRPLLPSFLYLASPSELPAGSTHLPWDNTNTLIVGELARSLGAKVPGRMVSSAKSWLCSTNVDRTAAILPWGAPEDVKRISPVEATAQYLKHIRHAWDHLKASDTPAFLLADQEIILTVPASFDEAARELTVEAAKAAGFVHFTLLEEPQAAFYAFISAQRKMLHKKLSGIQRVVVCDVGGGTTDFSLIEIQRTPIPKRSTEQIDLVRSAVGDHLMLGGDNMDLTLARFLEKKLTGVLDAHQFKALTAAARDAKEKLFSNPAIEKAPITLVGRGSGVVAGTLRTELTQSEIQSLLLDGFFPQASYLEDPSKAGRIGIREWGLPYTQDPAVTRHLSQFLRHHARIASHVLPATTATATTSESDPKPVSRPEGSKPDAILFNGGAMKPKPFRDRIRHLLKTWFDQKDDILELENPSLDLAVAQGAAYYGCVRQGVGVRIGGGMARAYYIGIETTPTQNQGIRKAAICLVPHGTEEGTELTLPQTFILRLATPVVFPLFSSSIRTDDKMGAILSEETPDLIPLPPLETLLHAGRRAVKRDVSVQLQARLTEVGTLELGLKSLGDERRWEIHLNIRSKLNDPNSTPSAPENEADALEVGAGTGVDPRKLDEALFHIVAAFAPDSRTPIQPSALTKRLESALELSKEAWPATLARRLADGLLNQSHQRARSPDHETRWINLAGYMLRPGFGSLADEERMRKLYNATRNGLYFVSEPNCRIEWWVLWRRLGGGLKEDHQRELFYRLQPFLTDDRDVSKRQGWPRPSNGELPEMWRTASSLELLDNAQKKWIGNLLIEKLDEDGPSQALLWAIGRVGARIPAHAPENQTVSIEQAHVWLQALLAMDWAGNPMGVFAAVNISRKTGDRSRDVSESLRQKTVDKLKKVGASEHDIESVKSITQLENSDRKLIFGDSLPPALRIAQR